MFHRDRLIGREIRVKVADKAGIMCPPTEDEYNRIMEGLI